MANYVFKPTADQALRSVQSAARRRLNTALAVRAELAASCYSDCVVIQSATSGRGR